MDLTKELGLSKKQPKQPKENLFQKANKQEEEVLKALLKIAPFNTFSHEAIFVFSSHFIISQFSLQFTLDLHSYS